MANQPRERSHFGEDKICLSLDNFLALKGPYSGPINWPDVVVAADADVDAGDAIPWSGHLLWEWWLGVAVLSGVGAGGRGCCRCPCPREPWKRPLRADRVGCWGCWLAWDSKWWRSALISMGRARCESCRRGRRAPRRPAGFENSCSLGRDYSSPSRCTRQPYAPNWDPNRSQSR